MYSLKIGLGGTGSNAAEALKPHSAVSSGIHHPSAAAVITAVPPIGTVPSFVSPSPSFGAASSPASSLLSRLASPSAASAFSPTLDAALSHVIPVSISARPVPLTTAENAAEVKRQERKQKKADRRKAEKENSQPPPQLQQSEADLPAAETDAGEHSHTNGHTVTAEEQQAAKGSKPRKQKKSGDAKRPLHDDEQLTLTVPQLKAVVAAANEKVVRECCKQMTHLSVKQRKEVQDSLTKEYATAVSSSLHVALFNSSVVQAALRRREEGEQVGGGGSEVVETVSGEVEGAVVVERAAVA